MTGGHRVGLSHRLSSAGPFASEVKWDISVLLVGLPFRRWFPGEIHLQTITARLGHPSK
jgi:hypothetical protein